MDWLEKVFERHTAAKAGRGHRLLIVDGHSSHVNITFLDWADTHQKIVHIMPLHSTHKLQPLDVGLFGPSSMAYSKQINKLMHESLRMVSMTKWFFYSLFWEAWIEAFTNQRVLHAFEKTGIWPHEPEKVLSQIRKPPPEPEPSTPSRDVLKTPKTIHAIHCAHNLYWQNPKTPVLNKILDANIQLAAQVAIQTHIIRGLNNALKMEKKKC